MNSIVVSFVISTFNRREAILQTLAVLAAPGCCASNSEVIVVDNAGTDGSAAAIRDRFPHVRLMRQAINHGSCGKNIGVAAARGQYFVFLDDDSFPDPGAIDRMIEHFRANPRLGAAVFGVRLPDGARECSAYPVVFAGCGVGLRASALAEVGGLPTDYFMQAEEYDLSLRLLDAGWSVKHFDDLCVTHLKTPQARYPGRVMRLDVRNNLTLIGRYFPDQWVLPFAADWANRYRIIARVHHRMPGFCVGLASGMARLMARRGRRPISAATFEAFTRIEEIESRLAETARVHKLKRVVFVDLGKNILPFWRAAGRCGLEVVAIADAKLGGHGFDYRGAPILPDAVAGKFRFDGMIISNLSPVHSAQRRDAWRGKTKQPVIDLFEAA